MKRQEHIQIHLNNVQNPYDTDWFIGILTMAYYTPSITG